jgi:hypothetical protein
MNDKLYSPMILIVTNQSKISKEYVITNCISNKKMVIGKFFKA